MRTENLAESLTTRKRCVVDVEFEGISVRGRIHEEFEEWSAMN